MDRSKVFNCDNYSTLKSFPPPFPFLFVLGIHGDSSGSNQDKQVSHRISFRAGAAAQISVVPEDKQTIKKGKPSRSTHILETSDHALCTLPVLTLSFFWQDTHSVACQSLLLSCPWLMVEVLDIIPLHERDYCAHKHSKMSGKQNKIKLVINREYATSPWQRIYL